MYQVTVTYGRYSATLSAGGDTLTSAQRVLERERAFYADHDLKEAYISTLCDDCTGGTVKACKTPRRHANGYHGDRCYTVCATCKGNYEQRLT
jgi:hypothetical protein